MSEYSCISGSLRVTPEYVAGLLEALTIERNKSIGLEIENERLKSALDIAAEDYPDRAGTSNSELVEQWLSEADKRSVEALRWE